MALGEAPLAATLPAVDIKRAKKFYTETLGLKLVKEDPGPGMMLEAGKGTMLYMYQRAPTKADHTAVSFNVSNIEAHVKELKAKGVKFEEYDLPQMGIKTVNGIATMGKSKSAWFKDTEGNIIGLNTM
jgi:predicted enzyme related to lactoylglutathione lyase